MPTELINFRMVGKREIVPLAHVALRSLPHMSWVLVEIRAAEVIAALRTFQFAAVVDQLRRAIWAEAGGIERLRRPGFSGCFLRLFSRVNHLPKISILPF